MRNKKRLISLLLLILSVILLGCSQKIGDYTPASDISRDGFARDAEQMLEMDGQEVKLWGFVDHGNMYGDDGVKAILDDFWSGAGPDEKTWQFNLKAREDDEVGQSFAVYVPNDQWRDDILEVFALDALEGNPTKVFVTGKLFTFDAPLNTTDRIGLYLELESSNEIKFEDAVE